MQVRALFLSAILATLMGPGPAVAALAGWLILATAPGITAAADNTKQLRRIRGSVGFQTERATGFVPIFGKFDLPDSDYAVTHAKSAAVIAMPDSALIWLGENTTVAVSAFDGTSGSPGSAIVVADGSLRFDLRRPLGGPHANYHFVTPTSQIQVRDAAVVLLRSVLGAFTNAGVPITGRIDEATTDALPAAR